jgi:hypothetical protein
LKPHHRFSCLFALIRDYWWGLQAVAPTNALGVWLTDLSTLDQVGTQPYGIEGTLPRQQPVQAREPIAVEVIMISTDGPTQDYDVFAWTHDAV